VELAATLDKPPTSSARKSSEVASLLQIARETTEQLLTDLKQSRLRAQRMLRELSELKQSLARSRQTLTETLTLLNASELSLSDLDASYARLELRSAELEAAVKRERLVWGSVGLVGGFLLGLIE